MSARDDMKIFIIATLKDGGTITCQDIAKEVGCTTKNAGHYLRELRRYEILAAIDKRKIVKLKQKVGYPTRLVEFKEGAGFKEWAT